MVNVFHFIFEHRGYTCVFDQIQFVEHLGKFLLQSARIKVKGFIAFHVVDESFEGPVV